MELLVFAILAGLVLAGALIVVLACNPVYSALGLLLGLGAVAGLFVVLWAEFLAVVQLMVYAGGVLVLFLFVIMLVDLEQRGLDTDAGRIAPQPSTGWRVAAAMLGVLFTVFVGALLLQEPAGEVPGAPALESALRGGGGGAVGNLEHVGQLLYTSYLVPFELASVLLLVAMIGAVVLAHRER